MRIREPSWMTIGVALLCGALYFLGLYAWAFWIIVLGTALVVIKTVRAVANPGSFLEKHAPNVFLPEEPLVISQYVVRAIIIIVFLVAAWELAILAGYLGNGPAQG